MSIQGTVARINVSGGGVPKKAIPQATITELGIAGDQHNDRANHGGPERALCLFPAENIDALAAQGHPIAPGTTGENITTRGIDWSLVVPGARFRLGPEVEIEITRYTTPCENIAGSFSDGGFNRMHQNVVPGNSRVYARVLATGTIRQGDPIEMVESLVGR